MENLFFNHLNQNKSVNRKLEQVDDKTSKFGSSGNCDDEVVCHFNKDEKLYVSRNFLSYASPVFRAMFQHECKEKIDGVVKIEEHSKDDFLEFLLCCDPGADNEVNASNYLRIARIAEKYQVTPMIKKCRQMMFKELDRIKSRNNVDKYVTCVNACLEILIYAHGLNYQDEVERCIKLVSSFGTECYRGPPWSVGCIVAGHHNYYCKNADIALQAKCIALFKRLPFEIRHSVIESRLNRFEDNSYMD